MTRWSAILTRPEWIRLGWLAGAVLVLHVVGWGLFVHYAAGDPALAGLGTLAYTFGLRHAFDADHIAAIDCTTRKLLEDGQRPLGVGFFFSIGHATVVLALTAGLAATASAFAGGDPAFREAAGAVGTSVSGIFLLLIGLLNLAVLRDVLRGVAGMRAGEAAADAPAAGGLMSRTLLRRVGDRVDASWKMYPLGVLFGLGFDTATEVGLLAVSAGVATQRVPAAAVLSLPIVFAAGMSLMDTVDGAFMTRVYGWALTSPARRAYYNVTVTGLSVAVALAIGSIELLQVLAGTLHLGGGFWGAVRAVDFSRLGYVVAGLFAATWALSALVWRARRIEQRWAPAREEG